MKELEECRLQNYAQRDKYCDSSFKCIGQIKSVLANEWVWASQTWKAL